MWREMMKNIPKRWLVTQRRGKVEEKPRGNETRIILGNSRLSSLNYQCLVLGPLLQLLVGSYYGEPVTVEGECGRYNLSLQFKRIFSPFSRLPLFFVQCYRGRRNHGLLCISLLLVLFKFFVLLPQQPSQQFQRSSSSSMQWQ